MAWGFKNTGSVQTPGEIENVLGASSEIKGNLRAERGFRVDGRVEGSIESKGAIIIGESGRVHGNVRGSDVVIAGRVDGNVDASGHLDIGATGKVLGDIMAKSFRIETGGVFRGTSRMGDAGETSETRLVGSDSPALTA